MDTYSRSYGQHGNYTTNIQNTGRELMTPDEVRMLDNKYALLFIRGERPVMDFKYNMLQHPNIELTANGRAKPYEHGITENAIASVSFNYSDIENIKNSKQVHEMKSDYELLSEEEVEKFVKEIIEDEERKLLDLILNKMKEMNEIVFSKNNDKVKVRFLNNYIKGFIFKSGTWLEIATNNLLKNIKEIDECRNGVIFLWNNGRKTVRNELDVIAVKDSVPICISCKDSDKYNEMALNELNVYANKIGGKNAYKILVATKEPIKEPVKMRAKEMGIHLVIFDGNEEKFINKIRKIIKN